MGDYWFSEKEREVLSGEFQVRSRMDVYDEKKVTLRSWSELSQSVCFLDAKYDWNGKERDTIQNLVRDVFDALSGEELDSVFESSRNFGAFQGRIHSFGPPMQVQNQVVQLPAAKKKIKIDATTLDRYSRCGFQGLSGSRWKVRDLRKSEIDLWPDVRGRILHKAVEILLKSRKEGSQFTVGTEESLDLAWEIERPRGLVNAERLQKYAKAKLLDVLLTFVKKEKEYIDRSKAIAISLEEKQQLAIDIGAAEISGISDRIDENENGIFVIDYKTSSSLPNGQEMVDEGYRLQLPFYALAARKKFGKQVAGVQYVELNKKGGRSKGIFFEPFNGKAEGALSAVRSNSKSLFKESPDEVWKRCEEQVEEQANRLASGFFEALPRKETECRACPYSDLCGRRRLSQ